MSKKTTYVIICFLELQMRTTYGKISLGNQRVSHTKVPPPIRFHTDSDGCNVLLVNQEIQQNLKCYSKVILIYCKMSASWLYLAIWLELMVER